jgi:Protein of unknown function (DUF3761)
MRLRQFAIFIACLWLFCTSVRALADSPQGSASATQANNGAVAPAGTTQSIRLGPPPASAGASQSGIVLNPVGSVAICRDFTSTTSVDPTSACSGHSGVLDSFSATAASAQSTPNQLQSSVAASQPAGSQAQSQTTQLDSAPPSGISGLLPPRGAPVSSVAAPATAQVLPGLSVQGPVSFQGPAQSSFFVQPQPSSQEMAPPDETSSALSPQAPFTTSVESNEAPAAPPESASAVPEIATAPTPPPEAASPETVSVPTPPAGAASTPSGITPPPDCTSYTSGPCVTLCQDGEWSSSSGTGSCSDHGGVTPAQQPAVAPAPPTTSRLASPSVGTSTSVMPPNPDAPASPDAARTAQCKDGSFSYNPDRSIACVQHGGIEQWLGGS